MHEARQGKGSGYQGSASSASQRGCTLYSANTRARAASGSYPGSWHLVAGRAVNNGKALLGASSLSSYISSSFFSYADARARALAMLLAVFLPLCLWRFCACALNYF